jgi:hypothetical protein
MSYTSELSTKICMSEIASRLLAEQQSHWWLCARAVCLCDGPFDSYTTPTLKQMQGLSEERHHPHLLTNLAVGIPKLKRWM